MTCRIACCLILGTVIACSPPEEPREFRTAVVERRDITVVVEAAGVIQPYRTIEVKSKASGEILSVHAETGDFVEEGTLLVQIDKRVPRNQLALVESQREASLARRAIAEAQLKRAQRLLASNSINEVEYENTVMELANAKAEVVRSLIAIENAQFSLDDTEVKAPIFGTVIEKLIERGQVISSPTMDVGGGTVLMKMADLRTVQVQTLVNEIDIGKIQVGQEVTVTVTSYPEQPFAGQVVKVEPQALPDQAVTSFPVLITLNNEDELLRPGMNAEVAILVESKEDVLALPTAALRTMRDVAITAELVGADESDIRAQLESDWTAGSEPDPQIDTDDKGAGGSATSVSRYWVLAWENDSIRALNVNTGISDLDYCEVLFGVTEGTEVFLLPSSGLVQTQQRLQQNMRRLSGLTGISRKPE
jgi:HlyD family secretion protein